MNHFKKLHFHSLLKVPKHLTVGLILVTFVTLTTAQIPEFANYAVHRVDSKAYVKHNATGLVVEYVVKQFGNLLASTNKFNATDTIYFNFAPASQSIDTIDFTCDDYRKLVQQLTIRMPMNFESAEAAKQFTVAMRQLGKQAQQKLPEEILGSIVNYLSNLVRAKESEIMQTTMSMLENVTVILQNEQYDIYYIADMQTFGKTINFDWLPLHKDAVSLLADYNCGE